MNTKYLLGILILILVGAAGWWYASKPHAESASALKIGVILPLTGNGSDQGEWMQQGLELAADDINAASGRTVDLVFKDNLGGSPQTGVSVYQNLENISHVPLVFTWGSGVGNALTPLVNTDHVLQIGVATAADNYSTPNDYTFRNFPRATAEGSFLAQSVYKQMGVTSIAVVNINNDYGDSSAAAFIKAYQAEGGTVVTHDNFDSGSTDFKTLIAKLKTAHPAYVYLATYPTEGALFLKQSSELGFHPQFVASVAILGSSKLFELAGSSLENLIVVSPLAISPTDPGYQNFAEQYQAKFGIPFGSQNVYSLLAYNALKAVAADVSSCAAQDTACMKSALYSAKGVPGIGQTISFDANGDTTFSFHFMTVKNGVFVAYSPQAK